MTIEYVNEVGVNLVDAAASDSMVAMAAWVSHDADSEDRLEDTVRIEKLINFLYNAKHMSPFEHGHFTFKIDAPLFVAREFMRHRTASYNEVSGRYTEMKPRFYASTKARVQKGKPGDYYFEDGSHDQTAVYLQSKRAALDEAWAVYEQRLEAGIAKEQAREELPLSLMTQFYVTMNPRNLMQFLTLRNEKHALQEIQDVAVMMEKIFADIMPITYNAYKTGRGAEEVDVKALQEEILELRYKHDDSIRRLNSAQTTNNELLAKIIEANRMRDEAVEKYNGAFVTQHEKMAENERKATAEQTEFENRALGGTFDSKNPWTEVTDSLTNQNKAIKNHPAYNIVVNAAKDIDINELTRKVLEQLEKRKK